MTRRKPFRYWLRDRVSSRSCAVSAEGLAGGCGFAGWVGRGEGLRGRSTVSLFGAADARDKAHSNATACSLKWIRFCGRVMGTMRDRGGA